MQPTFLVGSGVSYGSGIPLFGEIRGAVERYFPPGSLARVRALSPEALFLALSQGGVSVDAQLREIFNNLEPRANPAHWALAQQLVAGARVWTTNYDTLIEDAYRELAGTSFPKIRKPHGTFIRGEDGRWTSSEGLLFHSQTLDLDWRDPWPDLVREDFRNRPVVVIGYSGKDISAWQHISSALDVAASIEWIEQNAEGASFVTDRYPQVHRSSIKVLQNPLDYFVENFSIGDIPDAPTFDFKSDLADYSKLGSEILKPSAQFSLAIATGERDLAENVLKDTIVLARRQWKQYVRFFVRDRYFKNARQWLWRLVLSLPPAFPAPDKVRARSVSDKSFPEGVSRRKHLQRLQSWADRCQDPESRARILIARSRCLRDYGNYREAVKAADAALLTARNAGLPTESAWAQFEVVESSRSLGDYELFDQYVRLRLESIAMVHWTAWLEYERACVEIMRGEMRSSIRSIESAEQFFGTGPVVTQYDPSQGRFFCGIARALWHRSSGDGIAALAHLEAIGSDQTGWSDLKRGTWLFQKAEAQRLLADWRGAEASYRAMPPDNEMHGALRSLGLALTSLAENRSAQEHLENAIDRFLIHESRWGAAYSIAAVHIGSLEPSDTLDRLLPPAMQLAKGVQLVDFTTVRSQIRY